MTTKSRVLLATLGLSALALTGCFITQAQVFANFALPNPFTIDSTTDPFERINVDLNTISDYVEHKDKLETLSDIAIVGTFTNQSGPAGSVEAWITADATNYTTVGQIKANGVKLWAGSIGAAPSSRTIGWDESAEMFNPAGKTMLLEEAKGDGVFTIYTFGTAGNYLIRVDDGQILLTLSGGV
jgi:hypothetical protein